MNESKTPFEKGWLETSRDDNNGIKISHFFENQKCLCGKYTDIPADIKVNDSKSIQCKSCTDVLHKIWEEGKKDAENPDTERENIFVEVEKYLDSIGTKGSPKQQVIDTLKKKSTKEVKEWLDGNSKLSDDCNCKSEENDECKTDNVPSADQDSEMKHDNPENTNSQS